MLEIMPRKEFDYQVGLSSLSRFKIVIGLIGRWLYGVWRVPDC